MPKNFSCNLGSLNLSEFVKNPYTKHAYFDKNEFVDAVYVAVEALDTIIDENLNRHALKEQADNSRNYRNIGLGVMGYANALFKMGFKYGGPAATEFTNDLFALLMFTALDESCMLAQNKGAFPKCKPDKIIKSKIVQKVATGDLMKRIETYGLRNCSLISVAPTGSIATMLGVSGGCEPEFALSYTRKTENLKESYDVYCQSVNEYWELTDDAIDKGNVNSLPNYFVTSKDIPWKQRVYTQAVMQNFVDTAISSTINLPFDITLEEIEQIYLYAWQQDLKGITIFRDGCKRAGILTTETAINIVENDSQEMDILPRGFVLKADDNAIGKKRKLITGCGSLHCTAFFDPVTGDLLETYFSKGSSGGCNNFMIALSRMISLAARGGVPIEAIVDQLHSCGTCPSYAVRKATKKDTSKGSCCPTAIGFALKEMYDEMQEELFGSLCDEECLCDCPSEINAITTVAVPKCPECGEPIIFEGGCNICRSCGWSKCD